MCNVDRFFLLNTATSAKAAQHKLTGKLSSNVNFVYLDSPVSPVCPVFPVYPVCPDDHGYLMTMATL